AVAALAAQRAAESGAIPKAVYVFGMPRVGGEQFRDTYNNKLGLGPITFRLVHGLDVVASVPMSKLGFRHVGRVLQCKSGIQFDPVTPLSALTSDEPGFAKRVVATVMNDVTRLVSFKFFQPPGLGPFGHLFRLLPQALRDHLQDRYLTVLGENVTPP